MGALGPSLHCKPGTVLGDFCRPIGKRIYVGFNGDFGYKGIEQLWRVRVSVILWEGISEVTGAPGI